MRYILLSAFAAAILVVTIGGTSFSSDDHDMARQLRESGDILPLEQIVTKAKEAHPGRILEVELDDEETVLIYELEILDESGVVWKMKYDARTGETIKEEKDD